MDVPYNSEKSEGDMMEEQVPNIGKVSMEDRLEFVEKLTGSETRRRRFSVKAFAVIGVIFAIFQIYTAYVGPYIALIQRSVHVCFGLVVCILYYRMEREKVEIQPLWSYLMDLLEIILSIAITVYVCLSLKRLVFETGFASPTDTDIILGYIIILIMIDVCRKATGWVFTYTVIGFIAYGLLGQYIPGAMGHGGYTLSNFSAVLFVNPLGIYGSITGTSATVIAIFFLFGSVMLATGAAKGFLTLALYVAGRLTGGGAQVATISSAMFGMINGSAAANAATIGAFTIPMMKRRGYPPHFAAGVEAAASTGGQITPPVMGAGVFIMAEIIGVPYIQIAKMAALSAFLYYLGIMITIYIEAKKRNIPVLKKEDIPKIRTVWVELITLLVPVSVLVYLIVMRYTPRYAGFWGLVLSILVFLIFKIPVRKGKRKEKLVANLKGAGSLIWDSLVNGSGTVANCAVLVAGSQIIVCVMGTTGLGLKLANLSLMGVNWMFPYLVLAMVVCLILGLGLPTVPSYILTLVIAAPVLEGFGIPKVSIHLFIFYYAVLSGISLPVAPVAYITSVLAEAEWIKTCNESIRIGIAGFLVPFIFIYHPGILLLQGFWMAVLGTIVGAIGLFFIAISMAGFFTIRLTWFQRFLALVAGVLAWNPQMKYTLIGTGIGIIALFLSRRSVRKEQGAQAAVKIIDT